jgi:hypothetical protein
MLVDLDPRTMRTELEAADRNGTGVVAEFLRGRGGCFLVYSLL